MAHLAYHVHKSGRKTSIMIIIIHLNCAVIIYFIPEDCLLRYEDIAESNRQEVTRGKMWKGYIG